MNEVIDFDAIRISLASPEQIRGWSYGEVTKPETINYRTLKPERDGLFCERIFGPTKDFECQCGKYKRIRYKGIICDKCGVEVARAKVRRERMGHIELACAVGHIWFTRGIPSRVGLLLDLSTRSLERIIYFSHFVITSVDQTAKQIAVDSLEQGRQMEMDDKEAEVNARIAEMESEGADIATINKIRGDFEDDRAKSEDETASIVDQLREMRRGNLLTESVYFELKTRFPDVFDAKMGAEAILDLLRSVDLGEMRNRLILETRSSSGQRRKKASKQLQLVEAFRRSGNKPEWMVLTVLPVLPPDLRPMVQLDGGRFATSDLNDLYRRVINRNNRLSHLLEIGAPEIIVRNEKRMLQEAVDSLIDNGRRGRSVAVSGDHKAKSISDLLRGKQGRFRQNLLGKRVDYSGRSVIVVGPELKLHQCGLPRKMALELFKPFVMHRLVTDGLAPNIKSARRLVERARPEVYDILEDVVKDRPVLLNRAPTLHRLSIQAFEPVLIDGSAIRIHPLVCAAFNADFDGDQMAVHLPLSKAAVKEAREAMLSIHNMLLPSSGDPVVTPSLDMVFGCFYLTTTRAGLKGENKVFGNFEEAKRYFDQGIIDLRAEIDVRTPEGAVIKTTAGRIIFNEALPEGIGFFNKAVDKSTLRRLIGECKKITSDEEMAVSLDHIKRLGFQFATRSGITIAMTDIAVPGPKAEIIAAADHDAGLIESQYANGLITDDERYNGVVEIWLRATDQIGDAIAKGMDNIGNVYMMANSGAKGNVSQIRQMAGMRGLMTNPSGKIIDFPIKSSLREGLSTIEYFISTHGARKGLADTALRTSGSGYLTRRLIDVTQDLIIYEEDCGTMDGLWIEEPSEKGILPPLAERIAGRLAAMPVADPQTGEILVDRDGEIDDKKAREIAAAGVTGVYVRSPMSCGSVRGICQKCYWRDLGRGKTVEFYTAVGILAAQSIGEPGTQLTLRTFHTGGVVGTDITTGLPRVEELFEARSPKAQAIISEIDGNVEIQESDEGRSVRIMARETYQDEYDLPDGWNVEVVEGQIVDMGSVLATASETDKEAVHLTAEGESVLIARVSGRMSIEGQRLVIRYEDVDEREYMIPAATHILVANGEAVKAGQKLTDGSINPQDILSVLGRESVQRYLVEEVQKVYFSQGVHINDKHVEVIVRQMMNKVRIDASGDTDLVPGELVDKYRFEGINNKILAEGGEPATAHTVLMGITRASLSTESWLAAASFQETTRVLTDAAIHGKKDILAGLKENVIIGKLIPAQCQSCRDATSERAAELEAAKIVQIEQLEQPVL
ncbi:MAG: DNA-directed RNA polymerase subunit beta' [Dehalogenimonas sp.]